MKILSLMSTCRLRSAPTLTAGSLITTSVGVLAAVAIMTICRMWRSSAQSLITRTALRGVGGLRVQLLAIQSWLLRPRSSSIPGKVIRVTVPYVAQTYEVGQDIAVNFAPQEIEFPGPEYTVLGIIREVVDIGVRVGLAIELPEDFSHDLDSDAWLSALRENAAGDIT